MEFEVKPYLIYSLNQEQTTIIQTRESTFVTKSTKLIEFLEYLEKKQIDKITHSDFIKIFNNKKTMQESIDFLLDSNIIKPFKNKYLTTKENLLIFTNDNDFKSSADFFWKDRNIDVKDLDSFKYINGENNLIIICVNPFSLKKLKEIVDQIDPNNSNVYKFIFPYNHDLYISNYYSPEWGNPCPLCFFYSIESQLRGSQTGRDNLNFQVMVDLFYKETGTFEYKGLLNKEDWLPIVNQLSKEFKLTEDILTTVDDVLKINLDDYTMSYDVCYFWEMCDCYE